MTFLHPLAIMAHGFWDLNFQCLTGVSKELSCLLQPWIVFGGTLTVNHHSVVAKMVGTYPNTTTFVEIARTKKQTAFNFTLELVYAILEETSWIAHQIKAKLIFGLALG